jgi:hypothetical protein
LVKGGSRADLLEVAAAWDRLAEDSEKRSGSYFNRGLTVRPAALLRAG